MRFYFGRVIKNNRLVRARRTFIGENVIIIYLLQLNFVYFHYTNKYRLLLLRRNCISTMISQKKIRNL